MKNDFYIETAGGTKIAFFRYPQRGFWGGRAAASCACHTWTAETLAVDEAGFRYSIGRGRRIILDSCTRADLLEAFGLDKSLVKTAHLWKSAPWGGPWCGRDC